MSEWKNSPVIAVIVGGATVLTTTLFIVFNYALPVYQKDDLNKISELKSEIVKKDIIIKEKNNLVSELDVKLKNEKAITEELKNSMNSLSLAQVFQKTSALPIGYSAIMPGMSRSDIYNYYGVKRIIPSKRGDFLSVKIDMAGIRDIVYYFSDDDKDKIISIVVFESYKDIPDDKKDGTPSVSLLKKALMESLGYIEPCADYSYVWSLQDKKYNVFFNELDGYAYSIYLYPWKPSRFDSKCDHKILGQE